MARYFLAALCFTLCLAARAADGPFPRDVRTMANDYLRGGPPTPAMTVLTTVEVKGKQRPESFVGRDGTRYVASYDGNGRTYALTLLGKRLMVVLQRDDAGVLTDASLINLDTGITLIAASPREWRRKQGAGHKIITANGDVDYVEVITVVGTADDPFSSDIFGNDPSGAGQSLGMQQTFHACQQGVAP